MVAQNMAQSYDQLFHAAAQESQAYICLDELASIVEQQQQQQQQPIVNHQAVTASSIGSSHLFLDDDIDNEQQSQDRTYYDFTTLTNEIAGGLPRIQSDEALAASSNCTPESSISSIATAENDRASSVVASSGNLTKIKGTHSPSMFINRNSHRHRHQSHQSHNQHCRNYPRKYATSETAIDDYVPASKKRKHSTLEDNDLLDDGADDAKSVRTNTDSKKQNHSEIEKRRRDKMNTYITELSALIPICHAMPRKLDKLTVLRMAVQHMKTIFGTTHSLTDGHYKPAFLSDQELKKLILQIFDAAQAAEGFVFVVGCDRGKILYVSESVTKTLNYSQENLLGQSWFDILHPKDVAKVKEQLSSSDLSPRERLIDAKTMLPVKTDFPQGESRLCPGARRSFFCRMKRKVDDLTSCGDQSQVKEEADTTTGGHRRKKQQHADWKYCVVQCTGYLKSWAPAKSSTTDQQQETENEGTFDGEACNLSCLVAVGRVQPELLALSPGITIPRLRTIQFVSRHAIDGKFIFVDQRATLVLGFLPQELLGTSMYEYYHHDDIPHLAESHKRALQAAEPVKTQVYRFRAKGASFVRLQSEWKSFRNPWTKDIEYLIAKNSAVFNDGGQVENSVASAQRPEGSSVQGNYDYFAQNNGALERLISSHVEVSKIGRKIAEEVLDNQRRTEDSSSVGSPNPASSDQAMLNTEIGKMVGISSSEMMQHDQTTMPNDSSSNSSNPTSSFTHIINNVSLSNLGNEPVPMDEDMMEMISGSVIHESSNALPSDGNDEAAMSVIMSLLEADAGLGGPVDFSGLPWPLP